jgi:hypothetical protein
MQTISLFYTKKTVIKKKRNKEKEERKKDRNNTNTVLYIYIYIFDLFIRSFHIAFLYYFVIDAYYIFSMLDNSVCLNLFDFIGGE